MNRHMGSRSVERSRQQKQSHTAQLSIIGRNSAVRPSFSSGAQAA